MLHAKYIAQRSKVESSHSRCTSLPATPSYTIEPAAAIANAPDPSEKSTTWTNVVMFATAQPQIQGLAIAMRKHGALSRQLLSANASPPPRQRLRHPRSLLSCHWPSSAARNSVAWAPPVYVAAEVDDSPQVLKLRSLDHLRPAPLMQRVDGHIRVVYGEAGLSSW